MKPEDIKDFINWECFTKEQLAQIINKLIKETAVSYESFCAIVRGVLNEITDKEIQDALEQSKKLSNEITREIITDTF